MAIDAKDAKDLELCHGFVRAYWDIDEGAMHTVAPAAPVRVLMPRGLIEFERPDKLLAHLREFATKWTIEGVDAVGVELLTQNLLQTGRLAFISHSVRFKSSAGDKIATMGMKHLVAIKDGHIALVDELCTGLMPEAR
jgi:hypothetical protein